MHRDDETTITEISIAPDGRIYVFGASRGVLEALDELEFGDAAVRERMERVRSLAQTRPTTSKMPQEPASDINALKCNEDE